VDGEKTDCSRFDLSGNPCQFLSFGFGLFFSIEIAAIESLDWSVDLVDDPDPLLERSSEIVATADSEILDAGPEWFNLVHELVASSEIGGRMVDLSDH
jgi:hypothetical protein